MSKQVQEKEVKRTSIGGQALIEGVMMRGPEKTTMAVRHTSGEIRMESWNTPVGGKAKIWKVPFIRGVYNFIDSMRLGYRSLMRSAELSGMEEEIEAAGKSAKEPAVQEAAPAEAVVPTVSAQEAEIPVDADLSASTAPVVTEAASVPAVAVAAVAPAAAPVPQSKKEGESSWWMTLLMVVSAVLGVCLSVFLFLWLPAFLFNLLKSAVSALDNQVVRAVFEGVLRILLFVAYIFFTSLMKDIKRVYMYHGAEHKTIFCYEHGLPLTVENVRKQSRFHPRCGTSFMILMLLIGIVISMFIPIENSFLRTAVKLLTIPLLVGIGYEAIKLCGRKDNWFTRIIAAPGLWMQRLTTREPEDDMIECAIAAFEDVVPADPKADTW